MIPFKQIRWRMFLWPFFLWLSFGYHRVSALGIDLIEKITFHKDGSGTFSFKIDLTKTRKWVAWVKYLNKRKYRDITKFIGYHPLYIAQAQLKEIPDIDQLCIQHDEQMLKFALKFFFKSIHALNKVMQRMNQGIDPPTITYFSMGEDIFVREDMNGIAKKLISYQKLDNCRVKSLDLASFFKSTTYTTIYVFHKQIKNFSNPLSELSEDKKAIRVQHHVLAVDEAIESVGNRLHFEIE